MQKPAKNSGKLMATKQPKKRGGARPGAGRKRFEPTEDERRAVETMAGYGLPVDQIAKLVRGGIHPETVYKYFDDELICGKAKANAAVAKSLFQKAMGGDTTAMIFWLKTQARWKESPQDINIGGQRNNPIVTEWKIEPVKAIENDYAENSGRGKTPAVIDHAKTH